MIFFGYNLTFKKMNLRRNDETIPNKFRCRYRTENLTINETHVHSGFLRNRTPLRSSCEEVTTRSFSSEVICWREEMFLYRVVRLIKIDGININSRLLNTTKRVIGSEDNLRRMSITPLTNLIGVCCREVIHFTRVNMKNTHIINE